MGTGVSSQQRSKKIYLDASGKEISVCVTSQCSSQDLRELIATGAGFNRWSDFTLKSQDDSLLPVSPSIPANTARTPYKVEILASPTNGVTSNNQLVSEVLSKVGEEISKAFRSQDFPHNFLSRLEALEKRVEEVVAAESFKKEMGDFQNHLGVPTLSVILGKDTDSITPVTYPKVNLSEQAMESLKKPSVNIWDWEPAEMLCLIEHMFYELDLVSALNIDQQTLQQWLLAVQHKYRNNPFHNFRHCFCVTQMMYGMIHLLHLQDIFDSLDLVILLTSCICHDIDHPGFNNSYQINARTELAIRYNDVSPLENHHAAVAFQLLERPEYNIFSHVSKEDFKRLRAGIIELILATDMSRHSDIMKSFKEIQPTLDYSCNEHKRIIKLMLIKSCDISNEVRPTEVAEPWVDCLLEEYFRQSDIEKATGLPVTPFMDRDKVTKPSAQIGFIKFVLIPMFEAMVEVFPHLEEPVLQPLKESLEHYEQLKLLDDAKLQS